MAACVKIYFDGGCRPNPGQMEIAVVVRGVAHVTRDMGNGSGMDAEWLALIAATRIGKALGAQAYVLLGDALSVINQATGSAKCRGTGVNHLAVYRALVVAGPLPRIRHIKRAQNLAGIALARGHIR